MPDKRHKQTSLADQMAIAAAEKKDNIDHLVSLTYDSDPEVRKKVARQLGGTTDPRAIFALLELLGDKEQSVQDVARASLANYKEEKEAINSLEKLFAERKERPATAPREEPTVVKQKLMPTIEKLFSHMGERKAKRVRQKLMPSLEKLFAYKEEATDEKNPVMAIESIHQHGGELPSSQSATQPTNLEQMMRPKPETPQRTNLEEIMRPRPEPRQPEPEGDNGGSEIESVDEREEEEGVGEEAREEEKEPSHQHAMPDYYSIAYSLATTPGVKPAQLNNERKRILDNFKKEVDLAFSLAQAKAKDEGLITFAGLKPGMKGLSFCEMTVTAVHEVEFGKKKEHFCKVILSDGKKEVPAFVPVGRGRGINSGDRLALKDVKVDYIVENSSIALFLGKNGKIILVK
jgi:hypothetical protein